jgi:hypothetical protein
MNKSKPEQRSHHASDSSEQRSAERAILAALGRRLDATLGPQSMTLPTGERVQIDGVSESARFLVEVYAHQGGLRGGQKHKIMSDAMKLTAVRHFLHPESHLILCFADPRVQSEIQASWRGPALEAHGIKIEVVQLSDGGKAVREAQTRQRMVNPKAK